MPGQNRYPLLGAHVPTEQADWIRAEARRRGISLAALLAEVIDAYRRPEHASPAAAGDRAQVRDRIIAEIIAARTA